MKTLSKTDKHELLYTSGMTKFPGCQCFKDCTCHEDFVSVFSETWYVKKLFNKPRRRPFNSLEEAKEYIVKLDIIPINYYIERLAPSNWTGKTI